MGNCRCAIKKLQEEIDKKVDISDLCALIVACQTPAPTLTAVAPAVGSILGGQTVTLTGTNFVAPATVMFGDKEAANVVVVSKTSITVTIPPGLPGAVDVTVTTMSGTATLLDAFTYETPPKITKIEPTSGTSAGGTPVRITGSNFTGATAATIGGKAITDLVVVDGTTITGKSPAGTVTGDPLDVTVTTPSGTGTLPAAFSYFTPAPTITSVSPTSGGAAGGTAATVNGANFTGASGVNFGGVGATNVVVVDDTKITCTAPAGTGTVTVEVITSAGKGSLANAYTYTPLPTVTAINPATGPTTGSTSVTITGTGLTGATSVKIGGAAATSVVVTNDTTITAKTPAGTAGARDIEVTTPGGTGKLSGGYTYTTPAPTITTVAPTNGPAAGSTPVIITGTGFTGATGVTFGGTAGTAFSVTNDTTIAVTTPAGTVGAKDVVVQSPNGNATKVGGYTYNAPAPTVASIAPATGAAAGGTAATITGTGFASGATATIGGADAAAVFVSATSLTVTSPAGTAGAQDVVVKNPDNQTANLPGGFTYTA